MRTSVVEMGAEMLSDVRDMDGDWERVRMRDRDESEGDGLCWFVESEVEGRWVDVEPDGR